jgi:hypothetical protein
MQEIFAIAVLLTWEGVMLPVSVTLSPRMMLTT